MDTAVGNGEMTDSRVSDSEEGVSTVTHTSPQKTVNDTSEPAPASGTKSPPVSPSKLNGHGGSSEVAMIADESTEKSDGRTDSPVGDDIKVDDSCQVESENDNTSDMKDDGKITSDNQDSAPEKISSETDSVSKPDLVDEEAAHDNETDPSSATKDTSTNDDSSAKTPAKKPKKSHKRESSAPEKEEDKTPSITRSGRVSKKVANFEVTLPSADKKEPRKETFEGKGVALGTIACCNYWFAKKDSEDLKILFRLCFNRMGKNSEVKRLLKQFNGYSFDTDSKDYKSRRNMLERLYKQAVFDFLKWLGVPHTKSDAIEDLREKLMEFMLKPVDHKTAPKPQAKHKRKSDGSGKSRSSGDGSSKKKKNADGELVSDVDLSSDSSDDESSQNKTGDTTTPAKSPKSAKKRKAEGDATTPKPKKQKSIDFKKADPNAPKGPTMKTTPKKKKDEYQLADGEPNDAKLRVVLTELISTVDKETFTMKQVLKTVCEKYPAIQLEKRKPAIKEMVWEIVKEVLQ